MKWLNRIFLSSIEKTLLRKISEGNLQTGKYWIFYFSDTIEVRFDFALNSVMDKYYVEEILNSLRERNFVKVRLPHGGREGLDHYGYGMYYELTRKGRRRVK